MWSCDVKRDAGTYYARTSEDFQVVDVQRLHEHFLPARGLAPCGRHHEIYLSDPRRTEPARLKTILSQPVAPIA